MRMSKSDKISLPNSFYREYGQYAMCCAYTLCYQSVRDAQGAAGRSPTAVRRTEAKRSPQQPDPPAVRN